MQCRFLQHGITIGYDQIIKPCCEWQPSEDYPARNHINAVDIINWHQTSDIKQARKALDGDHWPNSCMLCQRQEQLGRGDSLRLNGDQSYGHYLTNDITLEIRPGNVCNFSCQTCWPEASSRVAQHHTQAGLLMSTTSVSNPLDSFDFLLPVAHRIKNVVLLGGEPFYDPRCKKFLHWASQNLRADLIMFTNGSCIDLDWLQSYSGKIILVFSIDAVGRPAEYIRYGTDWPVVRQNLQTVRRLPGVDVRVNVTNSIYNYWYLPDVIEFLAQQWPSVVSFGTPRNEYLKECVVPLQHRPRLKHRLELAQNMLYNVAIDTGQWHNAMNALQSIINNLDSVSYKADQHKIILDRISKLDQVKHCAIRDYCPEVADILDLP